MTMYHVVIDNEVDSFRDYEGAVQYAINRTSDYPVMDSRAWASIHVSSGHKIEHLLTLRQGHVHKTGVKR